MSSQRASLPTDSNPTLLLCEKSGSITAIDKAICATTTALKTRTSRSDDASERCSTSNRKNAAQRFLETHAAIYNVFNIQRHMISRPTLRVFRARSDSVWSKAVA